MKPTTYLITDAAPDRISIVAHPRGNDWLVDELSALPREGIDTLVWMLEQEEVNELGLQQECAERDAAGMNFVSVAIPDRSVPSDRNAFLENVQQLAELVKRGHHVAVHCRAGIGRSSLLAASLLILLEWDARAAFEAIETACGCPVPDTPEQRHWVISNIPVCR